MRRGGFGRVGFGGMGAAQGEVPSVEVVFDSEGVFHIEATDANGVSANGQITAMVAISKKGGGQRS
jgi:hypothetical protein